MGELFNGYKVFTGNDEEIWEIDSGGTSLAVQWLKLHTSNAGSAGSIPGWGTKIPNATGCGQKKKTIL